MASKNKSSKENNLAKDENTTKTENVTKDENVTKVEKKISDVKNKNEDEFRKRLEEKSKKYAHLPVYNKEEEMRKARRREAKVSKIFSSVDKQLGEFSDLTSAHMASHGITLVPSKTPFDEENGEEAEVRTADPNVHTIKYKEGVLNPRQSEYQSQGTLNSHNTEACQSQQTKVPINSECQSQEPAIHTRPNVTFELKEEPSQPELSRIGAKPDLVSDVHVQPFKSEPAVTDTAKDYENLGQTLTLLTQRMSDMTMEMKQESEIPFIDTGDDDGDFRNVARTHDGGGNDLFLECFVNVSQPSKRIFLLSFVLHNLVTTLTPILLMHEARPYKNSQIDRLKCSEIYCHN